MTWEYATLNSVIAKKHIYRYVAIKYCFRCGLSLRKHAYSNILKILQPKTENFQIKNSDSFQISARNIGGSNEYPHSMFLSRNKRNNVHPCKLQFYYIKVEFSGVKIIKVCFRDFFFFFFFFFGGGGGGVGAGGGVFIRFYLHFVTKLLSLIA